MLLLYTVLLLPLLAATESTGPTMIQDGRIHRMDRSSRIDWMGEGISNFVDSVVPVSGPGVEGRKKKKKHKLNKYLLPLIIGFMLIKSILLPVALKTLAILSGKAVVLSLMSLILAAIVGLKRVAQSPSGVGHEVVNLGTSKYRRQDLLDLNDTPENEPYKYYKERRRKK